MEWQVEDNYRLVQSISGMPAQREASEEYLTADRNQNSALLLAIWSSTSGSQVSRAEVRLFASIHRSSESVVSRRCLTAASLGLPYMPLEIVSSMLARAATRTHRPPSCTFLRPSPQASTLYSTTTSQPETSSRGCTTCHSLAVRWASHWFLCKRESMNTETPAIRF